MRPQLYSYTPAAASLTGFASNVTAAAWVLTATVSGDSLAHTVTIRNDSATDHSAKTAVLVGTNINGEAITETLSLPNNAATVTSTKYYKTLTSVTPSATIGADTMDIGWSQVSIGPVIPVDWRAFNPVNVYVDISGTINFTVQQAFVNVLEAANVPVADTVWSAISALSAKTADTYGQAAVGATAIQFKVNTVSAGATAAIYTSQSSGTI